MYLLPVEFVLSPLPHTFAFTFLFSVLGVQAQHKVDLVFNELAYFDFISSSLACSYFSLASYLLNYQHVNQK
jgi:hypothetical protein